MVKTAEELFEHEKELHSESKLLARWEWAAKLSVIVFDQGPMPVEPGRQMQTIRFAVSVEDGGIYGGIVESWFEDTEEATDE